MSQQAENNYNIDQWDQGGVFRQMQENTNYPPTNQMGTPENPSQEREKQTNNEYGYFLHDNLAAPTN